jgi:hypothetical protein
VVKVPFHTKYLRFLRGFRFKNVESVLHVIGTTPNPTLCCRLVMLPIGHLCHASHWSCLPIGHVSHWSCLPIGHACLVIMLADWSCLCYPLVMCCMSCTSLVLLANVRAIGPAYVLLADWSCLPIGHACPLVMFDRGAAFTLVLALCCQHIGPACTLSCLPIGRLAYCSGLLLVLVLVMTADWACLLLVMLTIGHELVLPAHWSCLPVLRAHWSCLSIGPACPLSIGHAYPLVIALAHWASLPLFACLPIGPTCPLVTLAQ